MLPFPRWKMLFIVCVSVFFTLAALPNVLPEQNRESLPGWMKNPVPLGLDLRGGSHLLLQLDFDRYLREHLANARDNLRKELRTAKIGYTDLRAGADSVSLRVRKETLSGGTTVEKVVRKTDPDLTLEEKDGAYRLFYSERALRDMQSRLMEQSIQIVNRRIDESGTKEPIITRQGADRIVVQVPGLADPAELKRLLGKTAKMSFHLVNESVSPENLMRGSVPAGTRILPGDDSGDPASATRRGQEKYAVFSEVALSGELLTNANATYQEGMPVVNFHFNRLGAQKFGEITQKNIGKRFAVVLDNKVITAPVIRGAILGGSGIIEGNFTVESANELATLLRAGALPAPLEVVEERSVGPSLGQDSIDSGTLAAIVGTGMVIFFMCMAYGLFGVFANIALLIHLIIIMGTMSLMQATLTLPGIAGIVLTLGMAVDANVLIFERMRDEIRFGKSPLAAIESGFNLAFGTIFDSNITTLFAAALLYTLGAGSVKGFAVTLTIGILSTMFASVMFCRMLIVWWARSTKPKKLPI
ncbi:MAG: protein translocase subunit SecD [Azospirillum brasilense]|nr:MAG: protein translocase subunit SecD [Azospirillum brasilense]